MGSAGWSCSEEEILQARAKLRDVGMAESIATQFAEYTRKACRQTFDGPRVRLRVAHFKAAGNIDRR